MIYPFFLIGKAYVLSSNEAFCAIVDKAVDYKASLNFISAVSNIVQ